MTLAQFLATAARRWYVVLLGAALTLYVVAQLARPEVSYWGRVTQVVLLPRVESTAANSLLSKSPIAIASLAVQEVNKRPNELRAASPDATLVGMGERSATLIQLRNTGVQWLPAAGRPYIDIEAVGASPEEVQARIQRASEEIRVAVDEIQRQINVPARMQVFTEQSSPQLTVERAQGDRKRAMAAALVAGCGITGCAVALTDRLLRRMPRRLHSRGGVPAWDH